MGHNRAVVRVLISAMVRKTFSAQNEPGIIFESAEFLAPSAPPCWRSGRHELPSRAIVVVGRRCALPELCEQVRGGDHLTENSAKNILEVYQ